MTKHETGPLTIAEKLVEVEAQIANLTKGRADLVAAVSGQNADGTPTGKEPRYATPHERAVSRFIVPELNRLHRERDALLKLLKPSGRPSVVETLLKEDAA